MAEQGQIFAPDNYRKLCEPFESVGAAEKAVSGFWDEFYELRNKYKIADAMVVLRIAVATDEGEGIVNSRLYAGDSMNEEGMAAFAYGQAVVERQGRMAKLLVGHMKGGKSKR